MSTTPPHPETRAAREGERREPPRPRPGAAQLVRLALVFYGLLAAAALGWRVGWLGEPLLYASEAAARAGVRPLRDTAAGLTAAAAAIAASWVLSRRTVWGRGLARALAELLGPLPVRHTLALALLSGLGEEAFFRGALQPRVGLVWASLLFGLAHLVPRRELLPWAGFSVAAGLLLGGLFEATGNLLAPVVAHAAINAVNLNLLLRVHPEGRAAAAR